MVDYTFYKTVYLGSAIPERSFPEMAARAAEHLAQLKRICRVQGGAESERFALCAMAEAIYAGSRSCVKLSSLTLLTTAANMPVISKD